MLSKIASLLFILNFCCLALCTNYLFALEDWERILYDDRFNYNNSNPVSFISDVMPNTEKNITNLIYQPTEIISNEAEKIMSAPIYPQIATINSLEWESPYSKREISVWAGGSSQPYKDLYGQFLESGTIPEQAFLPLTPLAGYEAISSLGRFTNPYEWYGEIAQTGTIASQSEW